MTTTKNGFTLDDALAFIRVASQLERESIVQALKNTRSDAIQAVKATIRVGDTVTFTPRRAGYPTTIAGTVTKVNRTTVVVDAAEGGRPWRVTASLVTKA